MKWFINLSTRAKLFVGVGLIIILLIIVTVTAYVSITSIQESQKRLYEVEIANAMDMLSLRNNQNGVRASLLTMMLLTRRSEQEIWHNEVRERAKEIEETLKRLLERARPDPGLLRKIEEINTIQNAFRQTRDTEIIPLIYDGKIKEAMALSLGVQAERYLKMRTISHEIGEEAKKRAEHQINQSIQSTKNSIRIFVIIGLISLLLGVMMVMFLNKIIAAPLNEISAVAEKVAYGELAVTIPAGDRHDEVGILAKMFSTMVQNLQRQTRDIMEAVNVLASSSNQIATSTAQLAASTEETAVAVTETTTTVEEVKQTANVSSQKAKHVSEIAQNAAQVSQDGSRLVNETVEGINRIMEQMEYTAEAIVKLSEHNQAIGDIIATVDDLAEQTNLLSVNASIEAAKAGEYGKGFIVVAQEIKGLAEQSKQATKQVRTILSDIQKASSTAVMATEKGSKAVEAAVRQSAGTGDSIKELSRIIAEASQAVTQIAASSQQQLVGMDQVALAMNNVKQAAAQNAAGTKQVEDTVRNLLELGQKLKALVAHYKV